MSKTVTLYKSDARSLGDAIAEKLDYYRIESMSKPEIVNLIAPVIEKYLGLEGE